MSQESYNADDFSQWVHQYTDDMLSWAFYKIGQAEVAEDVVQEAFLSAFNNLDKFEGRSQPKTWLFSILRNKIIDHYRKAYRKEYPSDTMTIQQAIQGTDGYFDDNGHWSSSPKGHALWESENHLLDDPEFLEIMKSCMEDLPTQWRLILDAKYIVTNTADEICQEFKITKSNYWQIVHRSKLLLKKCLEKNWNHEDDV